jgi:hypothetical protein
VGLVAAVGSLPSDLYIPDAIEAAQIGLETLGTGRVGCGERRLQDGHGLPLDT